MCLRSAGHPCEYASSGVRLLCLCPNGVDTPMLDTKEEEDAGRSQEGERFRAKVQRELLQPRGWMPEGRLLPEEVAEAALDMIERAETGAVWYIHGRGQKAWPLKDDHTWENVMKQKPE